MQGFVLHMNDSLIIIAGVECTLTHCICLLSDAIFEKQCPQARLLQSDTAFRAQGSAESQRMSDVNASVRRQQEVEFKGH